MQSYALLQKFDDIAIENTPMVHKLTHSGIIPPGSTHDGMDALCGTKTAVRCFDFSPRKYGCQIAAKLICFVLEDTRVDLVVNRLQSYRLHLQNLGFNRVRNYNRPRKHKGCGCGKLPKFLVPSSPTLRLNLSARMPS